MPPALRGNLQEHQVVPRVLRNKDLRATVK
jgi:hypothetical protein